MSGIDMALWDIRGKACGWRLYKLLGGRSKPVRAYAGGVAGLPAARSAHRRSGHPYRGRLQGAETARGENPRDDIEHMQAVRNAFGDDIDILTDANIGYTIEDVRRVMPRWTN